LVNPSSDYLDNSEQIHTVLLHSDNIGTSINNLQIPKKVWKNYKADQQYMFRVMNTTTPILPIYDIYAYKLFEYLMSNSPGEPTEDTAMNWLKHVNCTTIFPTVPFYLLTHYKKLSQNQRVKDSVSRMMTETERLDMLNRTVLRNETSNDAQFSVE
jgi:hypothetical protein